MCDGVDPVRRRLGSGVDGETSFRLDFGAFVGDPDGSNVEVVRHASD